MSQPKISQFYDKIHAIAPRMTTWSYGGVQVIDPWPEQPGMPHGDGTALKNLPYQPGRYLSVVYCNDSPSHESLGIKCVSLLAVLDPQTNDFFFMEIFDHNGNQQDLVRAFLPHLHANGVIKNKP